MRKFWPRVQTKYKLLMAAFFITITSSLITIGVQAMVPDTNGVIHACYRTGTGAVRIIDNSTQSCNNNETAITWNQTGPQGPAGVPGANGSALAYAHILADGTIDTANSLNVTSVTVLDAKLTNGNPVYCIQVGSTPHNISLTSEQVEPMNASLDPATFLRNFNVSCPAGTNSAVVSGNGLAPFYVTFN